MTKMQLFIPEKINVGFQERCDTYTKKLAYIIYYDNKGVLRKEASWNSWRDHDIEPIEFENKPTAGFVLNKGVGGQRQSYGWNARNEYIRVYDPRDFEFEISVANLLFILRECDCSKGKGLEGNFVYSWEGKELVLLPEGSADYKNSKEYTDLQGNPRIKAKDLIDGASYITKNQENWIYLGRFDYYTHLSFNSLGELENSKELKGVLKKYVFWDGKKILHKDASDLKYLSKLVTDIEVSNYAELVDNYVKSKYGSKIVKFFTKNIPEDDNAKNRWRGRNWVYKKDDEYVIAKTEYDSESLEITAVETSEKVSIKDGILHCNSYYCRSYPSNIIPQQYKYKHKNDHCHWRGVQAVPVIEWKEPVDDRLFVLLESGSEFEVGSYGLMEEKNEEN